MKDAQVRSSTQVLTTQAPHIIQAPKALKLPKWAQVTMNFQPRFFHTNLIQKSFKSNLFGIYFDKYLIVILWE